MYIERDTRYNLLYVGFEEKINKGDVSETKEVSPGTYLDFDSDGRLLGIEIVNTQSVLGKAAKDLRLSGELIGVKEAAEFARKDRANFLRDIASRSSFPDPVARVASGQLWFSRDVKRYLKTLGDNSETPEHDASGEGQTARLPYKGWEGRAKDNHKNYRYEDHEQYEDHEVMDTSRSAPEEEKLLDNEDHEVFRPTQDSAEEQESA